MVIVKIDDEIITLGFEPEDDDDYDDDDYDSDIEYGGEGGGE